MIWWLVVGCAAAGGAAGRLLLPATVGAAHGVAVGAVRLSGPSPGASGSGLRSGLKLDSGHVFAPGRPLIEAGTAAVFALIAWRIGPVPALPAYLFLAAIGVALAAIDAGTHRLPDALTLPAYPVLAGLFALAAAVGDDWTASLRAAAGGALLFGCYYLLAVVAPSGLGFGDVKLAGLLGIALGWAGWPQLVAGAFLGFCYGGLASIVLIAAGRANRKTPVPFGPFMLGGALTPVLAGVTTSVFW